MVEQNGARAADDEHGIPSDYIEVDTEGPIALIPPPPAVRHEAPHRDHEPTGFEPDDAEHTLVDLPAIDSGSIRTVDREHTGTGDTDELSLEDLRSLVVSVELPEDGENRPTSEDNAPADAAPASADDMHTTPTPSAIPPTLPMPAPPFYPPSRGHERHSTMRDPVPPGSAVAGGDDPSGDFYATNPIGKVQIVGSRYRIIERVGSGGMGKVFKVTHTRLGKIFALKIISDDLASQHKAREQFYREARMASSLSHPNVTSVVDFGEDDTVGAFMVMEFLNGEALCDRLKREKRLSVRQASEIVRQVAEALDYIHNKGIVHCDIKTENILLTELPGASKRSKLQVKLLDFGLARSMSGGHNTASIAGTPHYVAPERLRGEQASPSNDIYALGILFYELLTGRVPWNGTVDDILRGHLDLEPTPPSKLIKDGLDDAVEKLVLRALAKKPGDRHKNIAAFLYELQTVMDMLGYGRRKRGRKRKRVVSDRAQRAASKRDRTARALFDASRIPLALLSRSGEILAANPAFARFIMGVAVDVEGRKIQSTTLMEVWDSLEKDLNRACNGKSVRRTIKVDTDSGRPRRLVMWLDPGLAEDQAIFGTHPLTV